MAMAALTPQYSGSRRPSMIWNPEPDFRICVLGYPSVGKTAISMMLTKGVFSDRYEPTVEGRYHKTMELNRRQFTLQILDTMGHEEHTKIDDRHIYKQDAFLLVFDLNSRASFEMVEALCEDLCESKLNGEYEDCPIVLIGNKSDERTEQQREIKHDEADDLALKYDLEYQECSARDPQNVNEIFLRILDSLVRAMGDEEPEDPIPQPLPDLEPERPRRPRESEETRQERRGDGDANRSGGSPQTRNAQSNPQSRNGSSTNARREPRRQDPTNPAKCTLM